MKITAIRTQAIEIPFKEPIGTSIHNITGVAGLLVWIETDGDIIGESYLWVIGKHKVPVLEVMIKALGPVVINKNPLDTEALYSDMWKEINLSLIHI